MSERLFLVDGNSLVYRSFYAIQRLSNSKGFPTNAIYGFIMTLRKIVNAEKPGFLAIVFDVKGPTVRHELFSGYKAQRKPMPDDLQRQMPELKKVLKALSIPVLETEKYEADDVLATLARKAEARKVDTVIVSTDKDLLQLVDEHTRVYNPGKDVTIDRSNVEEVFGVRADQVADVLALWGDATDNIPGVPGIGEKTAKALIREFGSLDKLLESLDDVGNPRAQRSIRENLESLEMSRKLVVVADGLDVPLDLDALKVREPDHQEVVRLFRELEFTTLVAEYAKAQAPSTKRYEAVTDEAALAAVVARIRAAGRVGLDTETDNVSPTAARLVGISLSLGPGEAWYLPLRHVAMGAPPQIPADRAVALLKPVLEDPKVGKIGHNLKYDRIVLEREGLRLEGLDKDSMVLSYLLEPNWGKHNVERLSLAYLQEARSPCESVFGTGKGKTPLKEAPVEQVAPYACQDADIARELAGMLWEAVERRGLARLYEDIERPLIEVLARMELRGVKVDRKALEDLSRRFEAELGRLEKSIYGLSGGEFNINSPRQLAEILFHKLGIQPSKKTRVTKGFSTSVDVLEELAPRYPLAAEVLEYRTLSKLKSAYADALPLLINPETGRIHTSFNQTVASTGRLSSSDPNLQNIPARGEWGPVFRRTFIADEGFGMLAADYSQIELRLLAHLSGDPRLIETFVKDEDVHAETAEEVFGGQGGLFGNDARRRAKVVNFSIIYGTSAFSLAKELGTSTGEAQAYIDRYFARHPKVKDYLDRSVEETRDTGFSRTIFGRERQVPELKDSNRAVREAGRRIALNNPIQGSAADIIKLAMVRIEDAIEAKKLKTRMILQVHDELVFDVPDAERKKASALVKEIMEGVVELKVPLKVNLGWGPNWADAK